MRDRHAWRRASRPRTRSGTVARPGSRRAPVRGTDRPRASALLPEEVGQFDSDWRAALARASESLDLTEVVDVLRRWDRIAQMTRVDPEAHRRMLRVASRAQIGGPIPTVSADVVDRLIREHLAH